MNKNKVIKILETIKSKLELQEYEETKEYIETIIQNVRDTKANKEEKYINKLIKELK